VATIQIRDIPDDVHEELRRKAHAEGKSLQSYMRDWVVERTRSDARRAMVLAEMEEILRADGGLGLSIEEILKARDAARR
jgi:plasmid stability protein